MGTPDSLMGDLANPAPGQGHIEYQRPEQPPAKPAQQVTGYTRKAARKGADRTLLSPEVLETTLPFAKFVMAILAWANSGATMAITCAQAELLIWQYHNKGVLALSEAPAPVNGFVAGLGLALVLTIAQAYTLRYAPRWYPVTLFPDAATTALVWCQWILIPLLSMLIPWLWVAWAASIVIGYAIGHWSAKLPERLVFGRR